MIDENGQQRDSGKSPLLFRERSFRGMAPGDSPLLLRTPTNLTMEAINPLLVLEGLCDNPLIVGLDDKVKQKLAEFKGSVSELKQSIISIDGQARSQSKDPTAINEEIEKVHAIVGSLREILPDSVADEDILTKGDPKNTLNIFNNLLHDAITAILNPQHDLGKEAKVRGKAKL